VSGGIGTDFHTDFEIPAASRRRSRRSCPPGASDEDAGFVAQIVFTAPQGTRDPACATR
jgi:hypothetical protein